MFLPESERIQYRRNPLEIVVCQLRFPPILRIDKETPSTFQDAIRADYPLFAQKSLGLPSEMVGAISVKIGMAGIPSNSYEFRSADGKWVISLTKEWLALTCRRYTKWTEFVDHLRAPLEAFRREYSPAFYVRTGLRYQNILQRSELGLQNEPWSALLNQNIAGVLAAPELRGRVEQSSADFVVCVEGGNDRIHLQHGLGTKKTGAQAEGVYVLDLDIYTEERIGTADANTRLDRFNTEAGRLFRWCIGDRLHEALGPS